MDRTALQKTALIGAIALLLYIPVSMIKDLIGERQQRRNDAVQEIAAGWGKRQVLSGPFLAVPYQREWSEVVQEVIDGKTRERRTNRSESLVLRIPVDTVDWSLDTEISEKSRGIYKARLYNARIEAHGSIKLPPNYGIAETNARITWGKPKFVVGIADPRGVRGVKALTFGDTKGEFQPGPGDASVPSGIHVQLPATEPIVASAIPFSFSLELAGSEALAIAPLARSTGVTLRGDWPHPSFQGSFLPVSHEVRNDGFAARWTVSQYASQGAERLASCPRSQPCPAITSQELGVSFIEPVGIYQMLERASKYGFLFIGLVFAAFLLFELLRRLPIHPLQYLMVGLALAIFFLLLTALSEHIPFAAAYAAATLGCVGLITGYLVRVLRSARLSFAFGGALASLYGVLYVLLKAEDYSLLGGSVLLFALLAAAMIATRRVDWYGLKVPGSIGN